MNNSFTADVVSVYPTTLRRRNNIMSAPYNKLRYKYYFLRYLNSSRFKHVAFFIVHIIIIVRFPGPKLLDKSIDQKRETS